MFVLYIIFVIYTCICNYLYISHSPTCIIYTLVQWISLISRQLLYVQEMSHFINGNINNISPYYQMQNSHVASVTFMEQIRIYFNKSQVYLFKSPTFVTFDEIKFCENGFEPIYQIFFIFNFLKTCDQYSSRVLPILQDTQFACWPCQLHIIIHATDNTTAESHDP